MSIIQDDEYEPSSTQIETNDSEITKDMSAAHKMGAGSSTFAQRDDSEQKSGMDQATKNASSRRQ